MKKISIYFFLILTIFSTTFCYASTTTFEREELENYGVNKKWEITSKNKQNVLDTPAVNADEKVYDFSEILTEDDEKEIYSKIKSFSEKTKMDVVFVTVNLPYYDDKTNEDYAADFYDYNDFGIDYDYYSGILLLRNTYEPDPYFNIYTFGNAQLYFSYNRLENTLDAIYDDFHNGNYLSGFNTFIDKMNLYYENGIPNDMRNYKIDDNGYLYKIFVPPYMFLINLSFIITLIIIVILIKKNKMVKAATSATEYLKSNSINYTKKDDTFITSHTTSITMSSSSGGSGGSSSSSHHSSSSGSSGGGHSSGGGRHG